MIGEIYGFSLKNAVPQKTDEPKRPERTEQPPAETLRNNRDRFVRRSAEEAPEARLHPDQKSESGENAEHFPAGGKAAPALPYPCGKTDKYGSYMIRSTQKSTIYVDPRFYSSIEGDPDKIKAYSDAIENMKQIDRRHERSARAQGKTIVSRGWYIDKDGGIQSWSIVKTEKKLKKTQLEGMRDLQRKLVQKRNAKKRAEKKPPKSEAGGRKNSFGSREGRRRRGRKSFAGRRGGEPLPTRTIWK